MPEKQDAPSARRNMTPITQVLAQWLPSSGTVLEIASGSGQHAAHFAQRFPALSWRPSDRDAGARDSIEAWRIDADAENLKAPLDIDVMDDAWWDAVDGPLGAIVAINMIHISPWQACTGLMAGAGQLLGNSGLLYCYGPYMIDGRHTAPSNQAFDESLRARNPLWGLRDLKDVARAAAANGLDLERSVQMPADNLSLIFRRTGRRPSF